MTYNNIQRKPARSGDKTIVSFKSTIYYGCTDVPFITDATLAILIRVKFIKWGIIVVINKIMKIVIWILKKSINLYSY